MGQRTTEYFILLNLVKYNVSIFLFHHNSPSFKVSVMNVKLTPKALSSICGTSPLYACRPTQRPVTGRLPNRHFRPSFSPTATTYFSISVLYSLYHQYMPVPDCEPSSKMLSKIVQHFSISLELLRAKRDGAYTALESRPPLTTEQPSCTPFDLAPLQPISFASVHLTF
jgi:hypothetical protein